MSRRNALPSAVVASLTLHVTLVGTGALLVWRAIAESAEYTEPNRQVRDISIEIERLELPRIRGNSATGEIAPSEPAPVPDPSGATTPSPDQRDPGRGGDGRAAAPALALSESVDGLTLNPDPGNFDRADQIHRIRHSKHRRSPADRRATPNPMEWSFLASGSGERLERRVPAITDPSVGALRGAAPGSAGNEVLAGRTGEAQAGENTLGEERALGVSDPKSQNAADYRRSASVAWARPAVRSGPASVPTLERGRTTDTVDSEQQVASAIQALMTASSAGGEEADGIGGTRHEGTAASGGTIGTGFAAAARGDDGHGDSPRLFGIHHYAESVTRQVYPYWEEAMPLWARLQGRGGVAVVSVTIHANGGVKDVHLIRPSGIAEFDRNVQRALLQAAPYQPLPRALQRTGVRLHIAFDAMNPVVGRSGPGPGRRW